MFSTWEPGLWAGFQLVSLPQNFNAGSSAILGDWR